MTIWFRNVSGLDTSVMRDIAGAVGVDWSAESIVYQGDGIGFANGDSADAEALQDAAESILGYRPVVIDAPTEPDATR